MFGAVIGAGLIAAPLTVSTQTATAQAQPAAPHCTKTTPSPRRSHRPAKSRCTNAKKKCAAEWKDVKAAGKIEKGMKWPQFWSACNKRLKGA
jgi:hypothetical protein